MTDIIERLKEPEAHYPGNFDTPKRANAMLSCLCQEAAEEIESLRRELTEARQKIADRKADCEAGHDQDEATIAELRQQLKDMTDQYNATIEAEQVRYRQVVEKDAEIERLNNSLRDQFCYCVGQHCHKLGVCQTCKKPVAGWFDVAQQALEAFGAAQVEMYAKKEELAAIEAREQQLKSDIAVRDSYVEDLRERERDMFNKLSATQADNALLRDALSKILNIGAVDDRPSWEEMAATAGCALLQPQDTTALSAMIAKAGEVMRERCAKHLESCAQSFAEEYGHDDLGCLSFGSGAAAELRMDTFNGWMEDADAIRALPGVTLEDIE